MSIPPTVLTVIRKLCILLRDTADRRRLLLFVLSTALALVLGIAAVTPSEAEKLIGAGGYYYMLGLFSLFVVYGARVWAERPLVWRAWVRAPGLVGIVVLGTTAVAIWCDPFKHKILFDEYVLQGTAFHMHATKEIGTIIRAYDVWHRSALRSSAGWATRSQAVVRRCWQSPCSVRCRCWASRPPAPGWSCTTLPCSLW